MAGVLFEEEGKYSENQQAAVVPLIAALQLILLVTQLLWMQFHYSMTFLEVLSPVS